MGFFYGRDVFCEKKILKKDEKPHARQTISKKAGLILPTSRIRKKLDEEYFNKNRGPTGLEKIKIVIKDDKEIVTMVRLNTKSIIMITAFIENIISEFFCIC